MRNLRRIALVAAAGLLFGSGIVVAIAAASGGQVTSYSEVSSAPGMVPVAMAAGPGANDALIAGGLPEATPPFTVLPTVLAVNASTGQLDSSIGSSGQLPMPAALPQSASAQSLLVADNGIYASFSASGDVYVVGWNAQGQLLNGFGSSGLVTVTPPGGQSFNGAGSHLASGSELAFAGGKVVLGEALNGNGGDIGLYPLDPATGAGATSPVVNGLPAGSSSVDLDSMQVGPDGNLYLAGSSGATGSQFYYGVFDGTTLLNLGQTTQTDGDSATGDGIAFAGSTAYLGVTSTSSSVKTTQLWSAPLGSTTLTQGPAIPTQLSGQQQQLVGLHAESSGSIDAVVDDGGGGSGTTWVVQVSSGVAGAGQQVGTAGTNAQTIGGDALLMSGNAYFTSGEAPFLGVFGEGSTTTTTATTSTTTTTTPKGLTLTTTLSDGFQSGSSLIIQQGDSVSDSAFLSGPNAAMANGGISFTFRQQLPNGQIVRVGPESIASMVGGETRLPVALEGVDKLAPGTYTVVAEYAGNEGGAFDESESITILGSTCSNGKPPACTPPVDLHTGLTVDLKLLDDVLDVGVYRGDLRLISQLAAAGKGSIIDTYLGEKVRGVVLSTVLEKLDCIDSAAATAAAVDDAYSFGAGADQIRAALEAGANCAAQLKKQLGGAGFAATDTLAQAGHDLASALSSGSVAGLAGKLEREKRSLVENSGLDVTVYGLPFSDYFDSFDCIDDDLAAAAVFGKFPPDAHKAENAFAAAASCKRTLEKKVAADKQAPPGLKLALDLLDGLLGTGAGHGDRLLYAYVASHNGKASIIDTYLAEKVQGLGLGDLQKELDCVDGAFARAEAEQQAYGASDERVKSALRAGRSCALKLQEQLTAAGLAYKDTLDQISQAFDAALNAVRNGKSLTSLAVHVQSEKTALVEHSLNVPLYGLTFSDFYDSFDCVDNALAEASVYLSRVPPDTKAAEKAFEQAAACKERLERKLKK